MVAAEVMSKDRILNRFRKLGNHGDHSGQVFRLGGSDVEVVVVSLIIQITDMTDDMGVE